MKLQVAFYHEVNSYLSAIIAKKGNKQTREETDNLCYTYPAQWIDYTGFNPTNCTINK